MFKILGFQKMNFINEETGQLVQGIKFYVLGDDILSHGEGKTTFSKFIMNEKIEGVPHVDKNIEFKISFNQKGEPRISGAKIL